MTALITIYRRVPGATVDEQGNLADATVSIASAGWRFAPGAPSEQGDRTDVAGVLYGPAGADIQPDDVVNVEGTSYAVIGQPEQWVSGFGALGVSGCRVMLSRRG